MPSNHILRSRILIQIVCILLALILPMAVSPSAGKAQDNTTQAFTVLQSSQLAGMLKTKDFFLVNVHIPYEGEIERTDALIPFDEIGKKVDKLPADKKAEIVLYCKSGRMSEIAAQELVRLGYENISHLNGGMNAWSKSGYRIVVK